MIQIRNRSSGRGLLKVVLFVSAAAWTFGSPASAQEEASAASADGRGGARPEEVAGRVDALLHAAFSREGARPSELVDDETFLRRVSLDLAGRLPEPQEVTLFVLDPDPAKRGRVVEALVTSADYADNWARYWRDVLLYHATDMRVQRVAAPLEQWLSEQLGANRPWDEIATEFITATGAPEENGSTVLYLAHAASATELAAETSRVFLGIQIQCAECHDHPYDTWLREDFHHLAAFFSRVAIRREDGQQSFTVVSNDPAGAARGQGQGQGPFGNPRQLFGRLDADGDGRIVRGEVQDNERFRQLFDRLVAAADSNSDGALVFDEIERFLERRRGGGGEHYMPNLDDPSDRGTLMQPVFFLTGEAPGEGLADRDRRAALAQYITAPENPWFARALVNRMWAALMGEGFYEPVDDLGPGREANFPEVLDLLSSAFVESGYDIRFLLETIVRTEAYQRAARPGAVSAEGLRLAAACPTRLRSDQLFDALTAALEVDPEALPAGVGRAGRRALNDPRAAFNALFGYDPSLSSEEVTGTIPQALFLMNSPLVAARIASEGDTPLARLLDEMPDDEQVIVELYLRVLAREPTDRELQTCLDYAAEVGDRGEAMEDILWSLLNSTEFLMQR